MVPPGTPTGTYYLIAQADGPAMVAETNEFNNLRFSGAIQVGPDLVVSAVSAPLAAGAGLPIVVTDTTKNQGAGAAESSTTVFYLSSNVLLDSADVVLGSRTVAPLAAGASESGTTALLVPPTTPTGMYWVLAQADGLNVIAEPVESNNVRFSGAIQIGPDLLISAMSVPSTAAVGGAIVVNETTKNQGGGGAPASTTSFYLSANPTLDPSDVLLGSRAVTGLGPGASEAASTTLTIPASTLPGTYYVLGKADSEGAIAETLETNNVRLAWIRVSR
jgi:subtilase family serine protease